MNTKDAIICVNDLVDFFANPDWVTGQEALECNKKRDNIISLLQRGEKYRKVVEEINNERLFDEYDGVYCMPSKTIECINKRIKKIIRKYFPKEVKDNENT